MDEAQKSETLRQACDHIMSESKAVAYAVALHDYETGFRLAINAGQRFHAASTIKVAILLAICKAIDDGQIRADHTLHVRNRFFSAVDRTPFRLDAESDGYPQLYRSIGRTARISDLTEWMIVSSSNLATNLLIDVIGLDQARRSIERRGLAGVDLQRGVEDDRAFEAGSNNRITANGAVGLLRAIHNGLGFAPGAAKAMIDVLLDQQFGGGIVPGLPEAVQTVARVAHKTGDISTVSHDIGLVFLPGRPPYAVALLTESGGDGAERTAALTAASRAVYDAVTAAGETGWR